MCKCRTTLVLLHFLKSSISAYFYVNFAAVGQVVANPNFLQPPGFSSWNITFAGWDGAATTGNVFDFTRKLTASLDSALYGHDQQRLDKQS